MHLLDKYELRDLFYSPYAQACKYFFLAEVIDESIGRFDDAKRPEAAVPYHKDDKANKAIEMIKEVDALRQEASEKLQKANEQLADVKELAMGYRQTIKNNFPMEQWEKFGISDKR